MKASSRVPFTGVALPFGDPALGRGLALLYATVVSSARAFGAAVVSIVPRPAARP
jgi:hypothetical protein